MTRRGDIQRWTRTYIPTSRDAPADAETPSHRLLVRAGFIRRVAPGGGAGVYDYLPLGWRTLRRIERIVREEMDAAGAAELHLPALTPIELLEETGRAEQYGDLLLRVTDRHGRVLALGPTHEEVITELLRGSVASYRQLPLVLYQIQTKFRDEYRPRSALLRAREFIMKDAYSFHSGVEGAGGLDETYDAMHRAYVRIFTRCGLTFSVVEAEAGPIGGSASHEFVVHAATGEDTILSCPASGYAANVEKCATGERAWSFDASPSGELERVATPGCASIEDVSRLMKVKPRHLLKTVVFRAVAPDGTARFVLAVVRGDHEVNEGKVRAAAGMDVVLAPQAEARQAGFAVGYVGPRAILGRQDAMLLVDPDAAGGAESEPGRGVFWAAGGDEEGWHVRHFNWRRDLGAVLGDSRYVKVCDIRNARAGDPSPRAPGVALIEQRGIEVGHIFRLGTKYSDAMRFQVLDRDQQRTAVVMGCYGIGVSRTMAACVEMSHDEDGIIWPAAISPYHALVCVLRPDDAQQAGAAASLAGALAEKGLDVLIDDREERPGVKFKDADLIGVPVRLTIGDKGLAQRGVDLRPRRRGAKEELVPLADAPDRCAALIAEWSAGG
jgi:prolyl-tRNA synthetase